jgi:ABC-type glutathione transport system ATPase component
MSRRYANAVSSKRWFADIGGEPGWRSGNTESNLENGSLTGECQANPPFLSLDVGGQTISHVGRRTIIRQLRWSCPALVENESMSEHAIAMRAVTKTFGAHTAVEELDLAVPQGSVYGFIGPNGSGKTTTLRMIMRILHPDRGEIEVLGERNLNAASDRVGYLPEERGLYKQMKVRDVLSYYAQLKGMRHF